MTDVGAIENKGFARHPDGRNREAQFDPNIFRKADYYIYLYSVSDREFTISQPPLFSRLIVPARKKGEPYAFVAAIPSPLQQLDREAAIGDYIARGHIAEDVAASLVNPNNPSRDQDAVPAAQNILGYGVDLTCQGVFWSRNDPPTPEELTKAEKRKENYYRGLLERARTLEIANPKELEQAITQDYHMACEYFGEERTWHRKMIKNIECPNCGDPIKDGVAFHKSSAGVICIIDPARAKKAGVTAQTISSSTAE